jgi:hypothetical protein
MRVALLAVLIDGKPPPDAALALLFLLAPGLRTASRMDAAAAGSLNRKRESSGATSAKGSDTLGRGLTEAPRKGDEQRSGGGTDS